MTTKPLEVDAPQDLADRFFGESSEKHWEAREDAYAMALKIAKAYGRDCVLFCPRNGWPMVAALAGDAR